MKLNTPNAIKVFMVPLVALLLVLPLAMQASQVAATPAGNPVALQEATATPVIGNTEQITATVGTVAATAVAPATTQGNDFPWWLLLLPLAALLLIPLFMRRQQTEVVTRTTDTTPPPTTPTTTSTSTTSRTTVAPKRTDTDQDTDDHTHV